MRLVKSGDRRRGPRRAFRFTLYSTLCVVSRAPRVRRCSLYFVLVSYKASFRKSGWLAGTGSIAVRFIRCQRAAATESALNAYASARLIAGVAKRPTTYRLSSSSQP